MRALLVHDDRDHRRLLQHHLQAVRDDVALAEHVPAQDGRLPPEFVAAGFDVVLLSCEPRGERGLDWLADLRARPMFPPIIYLVPAVDAAGEAAALARGALGVLATRKIEPRRLAELLVQAEQERRAALQAFRLGPNADAPYRFGSTLIRGERCIRPLATSAMSTVYLAESEREGRLVVVKLMHQVPDKSEKSASFDRFLQEYEIIAGIRHPNVVQIYDLGVSDDHAYIAMEYFPAGDLRSRIKRGLSVDEAVGVLRQIAEALRAIHAAGVLHRDLKPGNVMLRPDGTIALIDFGLAKQLELDAEITATGEIFGTPYYMSPEQGHGREVDVRSDLYSLGVIFWEMLTGRKPFLAPTPMAVIYRHTHAPVPELPVPLAAWQPVIERLLAKDPADRYQSAGEVLGGLQAVRAAQHEARVNGAPTILSAPTPEAWFAAAPGQREVLLVDHANCEKKAASTALALMFRYADDVPLGLALSRLAREELRHHEQVVRLMRELGVPYARLAPSRYAAGLRRALRPEEPGRRLDLLLCAALIEARSCERFRGLVPRLEPALAALYRALEAAEARHERLYLDCARRHGLAVGLDAEARLAELAAVEAELVTAPDPQFRFHSGEPAA